MACEPTRARLLCMLSMTFGFFIVEVVVSRMTSSLSMLSDSFHMLSDVIALVVALVAVRFAEKTQSTNKNTFGWIRAEVMGALVNAVFLTALCFTIVLEAIERFMEPHEIQGPSWWPGWGPPGSWSTCWAWGHSHGGKSHRAKAQKAGSCEEETNNLVNHGSPGAERTLVCRDPAEVQANGSPHFEDPDVGDNSSDPAQLNMRGVFLHVLGDALGSVIVVVTAVIFYFVWTPCGNDENCINPCINLHSTDHRHVNHTIVDMSEGQDALRMAGPCWVLYLDPTLCITMVGILLYTTYPLLKESALILLQTVPKQINMNELNGRLLQLDGVLALHELHIWQLAGSRIIATAHIKCQDPTSYMDVAKRIKDFFHNEGIHATTIQPEFVTFNSDDSQCELACRTVCAPKQCCGASEKGDGKKGSVGESKMEVIYEMQEVPLQPPAEEQREADRCGMFGLTQVTI
uniref:Solute carrier family 30 member 1a n=1 Tax=Neogobius melanostomus TaxID=47308 RepID=A0A8C6TRY5_9GOBI